SRVGPVFLDGLGHGADPAGGDDVARERVARIGTVREPPRAQRIVDGHAAEREVAADLARRRRPHHRVVDGLGLVALYRRPEERLVLHDPTTGRAATYVGVRRLL